MHTLHLLLEELAAATQAEAEGLQRAWSELQEYVSQQHAPRALMVEVLLGGSGGDAVTLLSVLRSSLAHQGEQRLQASARR